MADLRREYGIDLLDLWRGRLSFYELCVYLFGLPAESSTVRLMHDKPVEVEGWTLTNQLLGMLLDTVRNMFAEKPVDSCMPKALFDGETQSGKAAKMQPMSAMLGVLGPEQDFIARHGG
jgi:hypothetical protein